MLRTEEVESLLKTHKLLLDAPVRNREKFLPTKDQLLVNITFLLASKKCEGVKSWEMTWAAPKRAVCVSEEFKKIEPEVKEWARTHPHEFEEIYERTVWTPWRGLVV